MRGGGRAARSAEAAARRHRLAISHEHCRRISRTAVPASCTYPSSARRRYSACDRPRERCTTDTRAVYYRYRDSAPCRGCYQLDTARVRPVRWVATDLLTCFNPGTWRSCGRGIDKRSLANTLLPKKVNSLPQKIFTVVLGSASSQHQPDSKTVLHAAPCRPPTACSSRR